MLKILRRPTLASRERTKQARSRLRDRGQSSPISTCPTPSLELLPYGVCDMPWCLLAAGVRVSKRRHWRLSSGGRKSQGAGERTSRSCLRLSRLGVLTKFCVARSHDLQFRAPKRKPVGDFEHTQEYVKTLSCGRSTFLWQWTKYACVVT